MNESAISELLKEKPAKEENPRRMLAIDSFIDLVLEGNLPPTTAQVAERSGVSTATLFRYFATLDELRAETFARMMNRFPLLRLANPGKGSRKERIDRFVASRFAACEKLHPLAQLQRGDATRDPGAARMVDIVRRTMADQTRHHFDQEIANLTDAEADDTIALIASMTSVESWEHYRRAFGRSPQQTRRAWVRGLQAILTHRSRK